MKKFDFIIVGGGIIGMTTARELALRGASVALLDKGELGQEASWAAGGILSSMRPWTENPVSAELSEQGKLLYPTYTSTLKDETGIDPEYIKSGLAIIEPGHIAEIKYWAARKRINVKDYTLNIDHKLRIPQQAILLPDIAQLRPPRLLKSLYASLKALSVSVFENTEITKLVTEKGRFQNIEFEGGKLAAGAVIITAGAWSKTLLVNIVDDINIKPIHGQMLCVKPPEQILESIILDGGHYLIPRLDGHVLIGSTMEDIGFDKTTTSSAREELFKWAMSVWPDIKTAQIIKHWSGLRPSSDIEKPYIGPILDFKNIYLNTGHFRKGILQAPASAKLLADLLCGESSFMNFEKFSINRKQNVA
jgi:glycine oxidase